MPTFGETIIACLEAYGVDTVFGIPGVHTVELYRGLAGSGIRHVTPRHEQGAGFMADGYARATGRPGVAFVISGPGLTNILTPMAQAYADSIPMLVISSVNRTAHQAMGGDLHEIRNPGLIAAQAAAFSHTLTHPDQLGPVLARAWAVFDSARPRPVHIQIPLDLLADEVDIEIRRPPAAPRPVAADVSDATHALVRARAPLVLAGGGARGAATLVRYIVERLDAPLVTTANGRGILPPGHPLNVSASPSLTAVREAIEAADVVLALGTEIGRTDYDVYDEAPLEVPGTFIRVDIDAEQMMRGAMPDIPVLGDVGAACDAMLHGLAIGLKDGARRAANIAEAVDEEIGEYYRCIRTFLELVSATAPGVPIVCDSTQAAYAGNLSFAPAEPGGWFNAATGYGALGYGLPAAIGAASGLGKPVICIAGDGGVQFSLGDLGTAVEEHLPVILLVWNNRGYREIKSYMESLHIRPVGVDLHTPDFVGIGQAYGAVAHWLERLEDLPDLIDAASRRSLPTLIEMDETIVLEGLAR